MSQATTDAALQTRLRDLSLVDVDTLVAGMTDPQYSRLISSFSGDLIQAINTARTRMRELLAAITQGPPPLSVVELTSSARAQDAGCELADRAIQRLRERAAACRALAVFDDLTGQLLPKVLEVDKRTR